jgi:hypothetical protein
MRVVIARLADQQVRVLWTYHHVILDGWSEGLVLSAVFRAYEALTSASTLPPAPDVRYRNFVAWSEAQDLTEAEKFWRHMLAGFEAPSVIRDNSPAITPAAPGEISHAWCDIVMSRDEVNRLDRTARRQGLTLATMIHGAWGLLLHKATQSRDVAFGSVASGRYCDVDGIDRVVGLVVVTQPVRSRPSSDSTVGSWLRLLQRQMADTREHEHTPLANIHQWSEVPIAKQPLFDSIVVVGNYAGSDLTTCGLPQCKVSNVASYTQPLYALTLFVVMGSEILVRLVYDRKRYAAVTAKSLLESYHQLLNSIAENPEHRIAGLIGIE